MKEKILTLPTPYGGNLELYKNTWGKSGEPLSIVSGLQGDHLNGLFLNSHLTQFLDSVVEGLDPNYKLTGQVQTFPVVNANAVQSGARLWPLDGMDMDLAFPGNPEGETSEAIASAILQHTQDSFWGLILTSAPPHYEDAPHIQAHNPDSREKKMCRDLQIEAVRNQKESSTQKVNLFHHWQEQEISSVMVSAGSPRTINPQQCEVLFQGILNFMKAEGILKDQRNKKTESKVKPRIYQPHEEVLVKTTTAGMLLKEVKVGSQLKQGQKIGEVRDIYSGKRLEELTAPEDGMLVTLRQYPIVYEREPIAIILSGKDNWQKLGHAIKSMVKG
ncbi:MAG: succinylglutamate desuccinylase/aspartoacylase family protein [Nitrospinota bacterium]